MMDLAARIGFRDLIDIVLIAFLIYTIIVWGRQARLGRILSGFATLGLIYVFARLLELQLTVWVFQGLFAVIAIVLIVVFQSELRLLFERIAAWEFGAGSEPDFEKEATEPLIGALSRLASAHTGALIVLAGRDGIEREVAGGIRLDAVISAPLIESIFDPNSPGHDGALLLDGNRASRFAVHLPLSKDFDQLRGHGTRHAAALGLAERTDALCLVVSEERGVISAARNGRIEELSGVPELGNRLDEFLQERSADPEDPGLRRILSLRRHWLERIAAVAIALIAWAVFVSDIDIEERTFSVQVSVENVPEGLALEGVEPPLVLVVFRASSEAFEALDPEELAVVLNVAGLRPGEHARPVRAEDVRRPPGLELVDIDPESVRFRLIEAGTGS